MPVDALAGLLGHAVHGRDLLLIVLLQVPLLLVVSAAVAYFLWSRRRG